MILYRKTTYLGMEWTVSWHANRTDGMKALRKAPPEAYSVLDRVTVPTDKAGLVEALNMATENPTNWPGEQIARSHRRTAKGSTGRRKLLGF